MIFESSPAVQAAQAHRQWFRIHRRDMAGHGLHQRVPLRHRFSRIIQHFQPVIPADPDEARADRRASHQLVRSNPGVRKDIEIHIRVPRESRFFFLLFTLDNKLKENKKQCSFTCRNRLLSL